MKSDWLGFTKTKDDLALSVLNEHLSQIEINEIDLFEQAQLAQVIQICKSSKTIADAGRKLFNISRKNKTSQNDSNRLKVYLQKFNLKFTDIAPFQ
jgi:transcriptional regulatory protein RtcR